MFIDFLLALACILLPFLAGRIIIRQPFLAWLFGCLYYFLLFLFLSFFSSGELYINLIRALTVVTTAVGVMRIIQKPPRLQLPRNIWPFAGILLLSAVVFFFIWRRETPYPMQLNWDIYEHLTLIDIIRSGEFSFFTSKISDTFTFASYPTFFHTMLTLPLLFGGSSVGVYWWLEYFHYLAVIFVTYFFIKEVSGNNKLAVLVATVTSALTFESFMVYESLFLLPQTRAAVVAIGLLTLVCSVPSLSKKVLFFGLISLILLHYVIGSAAVLLILVAYAMMKLPLSKRLLRAAVVLSALFFLVAIVGTFFIHWNVPGREEAQYFNLSLEQKGGYFFDWYAGLLLFVPVGLFVVLRKPDKKSASLVFLSFLAFAFVFSPFSYVLKYHVLSRFLLHGVIGIGAAYILTLIPRLLRPVVLAALFIVAVLLFCGNQASYKASLGYKGLYTHFSAKEQEAAAWLVAHKKRDWLLVSDPATQYILEGLSGVNSQGGAFVDVSTRKVLIDASYQKDPKMIISRLRMVNDLLEPHFLTTRIFVISGRYTKWQDLQDDWQESSYYNIWRPYKLDVQGRKLSDLLLSQPGVKLLYQNEEVILLSI